MNIEVVLAGEWIANIGSRNVPTPTPSFELRRILRQHVLPLDGVAEVRVMPREWRPEDRPKVFVILATHDIVRDELIIERLCQIREIDYDLVPKAAIGMIPDGSRAV